MRNDRELFIKAQSGDNDALTELLEQNKHLITRELRKEMRIKYQNDYDYLDDLEQELNITLMTAIQRFDIDRGFEFDAFAYGYLRNVRCRVRNNNRPNRLFKSDLTKRIHIAREINKGCTPEEARKKVGVTEKEDDFLKSINDGYVSTQQTISTSEDDEYTLEDALVDRNDEYKLLENKVLIEQMLSVLPSKNREILSMHFLEEMSQRDISKKTGIPTSTISGIVARSLKLLEQRFIGLKDII